MLNWYIRTFRKRNAIKLVVAFEDNRVLEFWRILKGATTTVSLGDYGAYVVDPDKIMLTGKNIPTFFYVAGNAEPVDMKHDKEFESFNPIKFQIALESKAERELMASAKAELIDMKTVIIILVIVAAAAGTIYYLNGQIEALKAILVTP